MLVTLSGMVMLVRPCSLECVIPMLVTLLGMVMLVRPVQFGMRDPDAGDAVGNGDARQASAV